MFFILQIVNGVNMLNISCHSLLACRVSSEKSADNLMGGSLVCYLLLLIFFLCF